MTFDQFADISSFIRHVSRRLYQGANGPRMVHDKQGRAVSDSAVMLLLGNNVCGGGGKLEPCLILNKRSDKVRQAGDLCCPGGGIELRLDTGLARLLTLPCSPLTAWPYWHRYQSTRQDKGRAMALFLAAGLRESFEEMRLNPLGVRFLGPLPRQQLIMFNRSIYPVVGWVNRQKRFYPNWEVASVVRIPLRSLFVPGNYARYRLQFEDRQGPATAPAIDDYPCFCQPNGGGTEILWGATYRIVMAFMALVFGFKPPAMAGLPVVDGVLDKRYVSGRG
jgi:hypothetical protein